MTLAVSPEKIATLLELARRREVEATVLGEFTGTGYFHVTHGPRTVANIPMSFLHGGDPDLNLSARWSLPRFDEPPPVASGNRTGVLLALLRRLNLCSGEVKARHYDHEVKGLTVVKPWVGVNGDVPAEATVFLAGHDSCRGFVLSEGVNPFYSDIDPYAMAASVVDLAIRRQLCGGARLDRIALLDNFCWPDPVESDRTPDGAYKLAQLVRACRGLHDTARDYGAPLVSGKDSMKNDSTMGGVKISVPPTLLVSALGQIDDVQAAVTLEPKVAGDVVFLLGTTHEELGGSEYFRHLGQGHGAAPANGPYPWVGNAVPRLRPSETLPLYAALASGTREGYVRSAATPGLGGWALAFARTAIAGRLGLALDLGACPDLAELAQDAALFSESCGRFLVTTSAEHASSFERIFEGLACRRVGEVTHEPRLAVRCGEELWIDAAVDALATAFKETLSDE